MRFSLQRLLSTLGISLLIAIFVLALTYRASESNAPVTLDFPDALVVQVRDETKTESISFVVTNAGANWFALPRSLVVADSPLRVTVNELSNGILTDAVRSTFSSLLGRDEVDVWQLDATALSALVEVIGGYEIEGVRLNGNQAIENLRLNEPGAKGRFLEMWREIVTSLDAGELTAVLTNLGSTSRSNLSIESLVSIFGSMQAQSQVSTFQLLEVMSIRGTVNGRIGLYLQEESRLRIIRSIEEG